MFSTDWVVPLLFLALGVIGTLVLVSIVRAKRPLGQRRASALRSSKRDLHLSATRLQLHIIERTHPAAVDDHKSAWAALTARRKEVALLAARGKTSPAIARDLVLSPRTVENHLSQVYEKLRVNSRAELKVLLQDIGVLPSHPQDRDE